MVSYKKQGKAEAEARLVFPTADRLRNYAAEGVEQSLKGIFQTLELLALVDFNLDIEVAIHNLCSRS